MLRVAVRNYGGTLLVTIKVLSEASETFYFVEIGKMIFSQCFFAVMGNYILLSI